MLELILLVISSKIRQSGHCVFEQQDSLSFQLRPHAEALLFGPLQLSDKVREEFYLFAELCLLGEEDPRVLGDLAHLLDQDLVLLDSLVQLLDHELGLELHFLVLGPVDHVLAVPREASVEGLRGEVEHSLLDAAVFLVDPVQELGSVVQDVLQLSKRGLNGLLHRLQLRYQTHQAV